MFFSRLKKWFPVFVGMVVGTPTAFSAGAFHADKWRPGIYIKLEDWQLQNATTLENVYQEVEDTPAIRGIKITFHWGRYESKNLQTGAITRDFSLLDDILARLSTMEDKHLIILVPWREFNGNTEGAANLLPEDLRGGGYWTDPNPNPPDWSHMKYDRLWAYEKSTSTTPEYGYNLKLWDPVVLSRLDSFLKALADHVDAHPRFNQISTTESAIGSPLVPFGPGEGDTAQYAGQVTVLRAMRKHFTRSLVVTDLNFSRPHLAEVIPLLEPEGIGLGCSNSHKDQSLTTRGPPPGIHTYFPGLSGKIPLVPEIQGWDYKSSNGVDIDFPSYESLYLRVRNDLKANYTVMQRNEPFWSGNGTTPSVLDFLRTYPTIVNDPTGAGGLNAGKPGTGETLGNPQQLKVK